ncbi:MAG: Holliday junction resolvase RecU [Butyricicoccus sp.]
MATLNINQLRPDEQAALRSWRAMNANAKGQAFEAAIRVGLEFYAECGIARIEKTPEPFFVMRKNRDGTFLGRFSRQNKAQPDFTGTLRDGRSVMFEAKSVSGDRVTRRLLTDRQMELLEAHHRLGAITFVVVELNGRHYTIPWPIWRDMQQFYHAAHIKERDLWPYEVHSHRGVMVLERVDRMAEMLENNSWREGRR